MRCLRCGFRDDQRTAGCPKCGAAIPDEVGVQKSDFLKRTEVCSPDQVIDHAFAAALKRNSTYAAGPVEAPWAFRLAFKTEIVRQGRQYRAGLSDGEHMVIIQDMANKLSQEFCDVLDGGRLRIGTVQKALNLFVKFMWCLERDWATPPHCPVDRIVLQAAGIYANWTQLDSIDEYRMWIGRLRRFAAKSGYPSLAEWELGIWNSRS